MSDRTPGQAAFEAYERSASGDPGYRPYPWPKVDRRGRRNWDAAAQAAIAAGSARQPGMTGAAAELAARRTAAAAVAADFHAAAVAFQRGGEQPDYAMWAQRLERHLLYVLDALATGDGDQGTTQLARVRQVLDAFDWETDDRQYALEKIDDILNGRPRP